MTVEDLLSQLKLQLDIGALKLTDEVILHTGNGWYRTAATAAPPVIVKDFRKEEVTLFFTQEARL